MSDDASWSRSARVHRRKGRPWRVSQPGRWSWPPDKWQRLSIVAGLVGPARNVLDVGGRAHELARLLTGIPVTSLNIEEPADLVVPAGRLPVPDGRYDVVTSCDVLEHLPPTARSDHVAEIVRVARRRVVMCFPVGSREKDAAERALADELLRRHGRRFDFLDEHLEHGLPRPADVVVMVGAADPSAHASVWFQDGTAEGDRVLLDAVQARHRLDPRAFARFAVAWIRRPRPRLTQVVGPENNRAYVVVELSPNDP